MDSTIPIEQPPSESLKDTFGALLLGGFFTLSLYGICIHRAYRYIRVAHGDTLKLKMLVASVVFFNTVQVTLIMHALYYYLVSQYFRPSFLTHSVWSLNLTPFFTALLTVTSQGFFVTRVCLISYRDTIAGVVAALLLVAKLVCGMLFAVEGFKTNSTSFLTSHIFLFQLALGFATLANIILTGSLTSVLRRGCRFSSRSTVSDDDSWSSWFTVWIVNTGGLVLFCDGLAFILSLSASNTMYWMFFYMVTSPVVAMTLLTVLSTRKLYSNRNMYIIQAGDVGRNTIARVGRHAQLERFNVPQIQDDVENPTMIDVKVETQVNQVLSETLSADLSPFNKRK